jgi:arylsulfatase A-like enzyme
MKKVTHFHKTGPALIVGLVFLLALVTPDTLYSQKPNIVYIMTDDMGFGDLSNYGGKEFATPNLDQLASRGIRFLNAYSAGPLCTPTRAAFMTGRYPGWTTVGLIEPLTAQPSDTTYGLTPADPSVATLMRAAGYKTALIGKWHLGIQSKHRPTKNGFDYFFGFLTGAVDYISHKGDNRKHDLYENDSPVFPSGYLTDLLTEKTVDFLKQKHDKPFFLAVNFNAPHWPWQGPRDAPYPDSLNFRAGGSPAIYAAMMKSLDDGIGSIIKALDNTKSSRETLIIFTNDNGGERYSNHGGLSHAKSTVWEGGIRVPAFVIWPGKIKSGALTEQVAITMDWTITILSVGGAKYADNIAQDGIDLIPVLTGKKAEVERTLYWRLSQRTKQKAIRSGDWKYLEDETGEYLFNLKNDKAEKVNLKQNHADRFDLLKGKLSEWEKKLLKPIPL